MTERIPDWQLERYALGELPPERIAAIRARVEADPELAARLASLRANDAAFLAAWPPARVVPGLEAKARAGRSGGWSRGWWIVPALAAAAAVVVVARFPERPAIGGESAEAVEEGRVKGIAPALLVYRSGDGGVERLEAGATAHAGDLLQLGYVGAGARYGVVLSIDGNGVVTGHAFGQDGSALSLKKGEVRLPSSYELDAAPRFERFFLVTGDAPFAYGPVRAAAERLAGRPDADTAPLDLPATLAQTSLLLAKEEP